MYVSADRRRQGEGRALDKMAEGAARRGPRLNQVFRRSRFRSGESGSALETDHSTRTQVCVRPNMGTPTYPRTSSFLPPSDSDILLL